MSHLFLTKWPFLWKLRLFLGLILAVILLSFLYFKIVPGGRITYDLKWPRGLASGRGFIYNFQPAARLDAGSQTGLKIIADPVYFSLFAPRTFSHATVTIKYLDKLSTATPIIELGVLKDKLAGSYELQPLQNKILDEYQAQWSRLPLNTGGFILQADKNYSSAPDFLAALAAGRLKDCPGGPFTCLATYNYPLSLNFKLPSGTIFHPLTITQPLRGLHRFYTYFPAGPWRLSFSFTDLGQVAGSDPITVNVWAADKLVADKTLSDNNLTLTGESNESRQIILSGQAQSAGVYKVEVKISDDVVIKRIESSSDKLAFIGRIWPVSGPGNLKLFTDSSVLRVGTSNPASLGDISFGGQKFFLAQAYKQFSWSGGDGVQEIDLPKDDIILSDNGVLAFSANSLFNPDMPTLDRDFLSTGSVKYIIADYSSPREGNGEQTATATFDLSGAVRENGYYTWVISVPGLVLADTTGVGAGTAAGTGNNYLEIKEIKIDLSGKTLWQKIR